MDVQTVMQELEALGSEQTRKTWRRHGATGAIFGVKIGDMKQLMRKLKIKNNTELAKELYLTENADAMYLAGLVVNPKELVMDDFKLWIELAQSRSITESIIPWCAAESGLGLEVAEYCLGINDDKHQSMGYATLGSYVIVTPDEMIDTTYIQQQLTIVEQTIQTAENRTRYTMNNFLICVATSFAPLYEEVMQIVHKMEPVYVDMEGTACKVPDAVSYIEKVNARYGGSHKKSKVRC